jgi:hypothetical protein
VVDDLDDDDCGIWGSVRPRPPVSNPGVSSITGHGNNAGAVHSDETIV